MKTEAEIRKILEYIESINAHNFSESEKGAEPSYTSIFEDKKTGKPEVFRGNSAFSVLDNVLLAMSILRWILEEPDVCIDDECEEGYRLVSDYSPEGLVERLEKG